MCKRKMKKKKKKEQEKVKLKGAKPGKKLKRIQPGKMEKKAMVSKVCFLGPIITYSSSFKDENCFTTITFEKACL